MATTALKPASAAAPSATAKPRFLSPDKFLALEIGVPRRFGLADIGPEQLRGGWSPPEAAHNWNDGYEAELTLAISALPDAVCTLSIEGRPHLAGSIARQDVTLFFNGRRLAFWRLDRLDGYTLRADIEPEYFLRRHGGGFGKCAFHLPDSVRPCDVSAVADARRLGFCFQTLTLTRASQKLRK
jgi:hypothetical protein